MRTPPTVTVCIPTCDRPDLLAEAFQSCLHQSRPPDEIVIGDDSAGDKTERLVMKWQADANASIRYRRNRPRLGQNSNINSLFDRATGSHLILLHDDDLLASTAIETLLRCWEEHPDLVGAFGKQHILHPNGEIDADASERLNWTYRRTRAQAGLQVDSWSVGISQQWPNDGYMVLTSAARRVRWRSRAEVGFGGEFDFGLRLGMNAPPQAFYFVDEFTSSYRLSEAGSISSSHTDDAALQACRIARELAKTCPPERRDWIEDKLRRSSPHAIMQAIRHGHLREAWGMYWSEYHPWRVRFTLGGVRRLLLMLLGIARYEREAR